MDRSISEKSRKDKSPKAAVESVRRFILSAYYSSVNSHSVTLQEDIDVLKATLFLHYLSRYAKKRKKSIIETYSDCAYDDVKYPAQAFEADLHGSFRIFWSNTESEAIIKEASESATLLKVTDILTYSPILGSIVDTDYLQKIRNQLKRRNTAFGNEINWIRTILCAWLTKGKSDERPSLFARYKSVLKEHGLPYENLPELNTLFSYLTMYPFSNCMRQNDSMLESLYQKLKDKGCSEEAILNLYWQSFHMSNPSQNQQNTVQHRDDIQTLVLSIKQIAQKHSDVIASVMEHRDGNGDAIETGYVRQKFLEGVSSKSKILVIQPSAFFIQKWPNQRMNVTTFCVMTDVEAKLLQEEFPRGKFCTTKQLINSNLSLYSHILYFQRTAETAESKQLAFSSIKGIKKQKDPNVFMALIGRKETKLTEEALNQRFKNVSEYILPRQVFPDKCACPRVPKLQKVLFASEKANWSDSASSCNSKKVRFITNGIVRTYRDTLSGKENEEVYLEDWASMEMNPKSKVDFGKDNKKVNKPKERVRKKIAFSKDITIWYSTKKYSKDKYRVEANIYRLPTSNQLSRNRVDRGKRIPDSYGSYVYSAESDANRWLVTTYSFQEKTQRAIIEAFKGRGRKELTIKTVWYLTMDTAEYWDEGSIDRRLFYLMPYLLNVTVKDCTTEELETCVGRFAKENNLRPTQMRPYYESLEVLFDRFEKMKLREDNPAFSLIEEYRAKRSTEDKIREALTKKSFTIQEMKSIYQCLEKKIATEENAVAYLGVMMRLLTGLNSAVLCALQWQDICEIPGTDAHQFLIFKKVSSNGNSVNFLTRRTEYRRFPIPTMLYRLLMEYREKLKKSNPSRVLKKTDYILAAPKDLKKDGSSQFPRPRKLIRAGNDIINELGFKNVEIYIPIDSNDSENKEQIIDLGHYRGDIFNTNYRMHLKHDCRMLQSEENHLMGLTQKETFSKHYLDYNHDMKQLQMLEKMDRLEPLLVPQKLTEVLSIEENDDALVIAPKVGFCAVAEYEFSAQQDTEITIMIDSTNGEKVYYQLLD